MKDKTKFRILILMLTIAFFIAMGWFATDQINKAQKEEDRFLRIESEQKRIKSRIDSLEIAIYPKWKWNPDTKKWEEK